MPKKRDSPGATSRTRDDYTLEQKDAIGVLVKKYNDAGYNIIEIMFLMHKNHKIDVTLNQYRDWNKQYWGHTLQPGTEDYHNCTKETLQGVLNSLEAYCTQDLRFRDIAFLIYDQHQGFKAAETWYGNTARSWGFTRNTSRKSAETIAHQLCGHRCSTTSTVPISIRKTPIERQHRPGIKRGVSSQPVDDLAYPIVSNNEEKHEVCGVGLNDCLAPTSFAETQETRSSEDDVVLVDTGCSYGAPVVVQQTGLSTQDVQSIDMEPIIDDQSLALLNDFRVLPHSNTIATLEPPTRNHSFGGTRNGASIESDAFVHISNNPANSTGSACSSNDLSALQYLEHCKTHSQSRGSDDNTSQIPSTLQDPGITDILMLERMLILLIEDYFQWLVCNSVFLEARIGHDPQAIFDVGRRPWTFYAQTYNSLQYLLGKDPAGPQRANSGLVEAREEAIRAFEHPTARLLVCILLYYFIACEEVDQESQKEFTLSLHGDASNSSMLGPDHPMTRILKILATADGFPKSARSRVATSLIDAVKEKCPKEFDVLYESYELAIRLFKSEGKYDAAVWYCDELIEHAKQLVFLDNSHLLRAKRLKGRTLFEQGRITEAADIFHRLLIVWETLEKPETTSKEWMVWEDLAKLKTVSGNSEDALNCLVEAINFSKRCYFSGENTNRLERGLESLMKNMTI